MIWLLVIGNLTAFVLTQVALRQYRSGLVLAALATMLVTWAVYVAVGS